MLMDIILKHGINEYYQCKIDIVDTIDKAIWWIIENSNSYPQYPLIVRIKILLNALPHFQKLAKENLRLGGKHKNSVSDLNNFRPIDCLKIISDKAGCSRELVNEAKYIIKYGTPADVEKCSRGSAITTVYKEVKKRVCNSPERNAAYDNVYYVNPAAGHYTDQVHQGNNLDIIKEMQFNNIQDIAATIYSSNYNVGKDYGPGFNDSVPHEEFIDNLGNVVYEAQKLGRDGMRIILIFPQTTNKNSKSGGDYRHSLLADMIYKIKEMNAKYEDCDLRFWGHFDWFKNHAGGNVCQGSISATCPVLRPDAEYIAVWVKKNKNLENIHGYDYKPQKPAIFNDSDRDKYIITPDEYYKWTLQTWHISPMAKFDCRHPAIYPEELCHRLIKLFTHPLDTILDPYCGSGTTLVAAKKLKRHYIGIDQNAAYCKMSRDRLAEVDEMGEKHE